MAARFFVDENDLALGKALAERREVSCSPAMLISQKSHVRQRTTLGCQSSARDALSLSLETSAFATARSNVWLGFLMELEDSC